VLLIIISPHINSFLNCFVLKRARTMRVFIFMFSVVSLFDEVSTMGLTCHLSQMYVCFPVANSLFPKSVRESLLLAWPIFLFNKMNLHFYCTLNCREREREQWHVAPKWCTICSWHNGNYVSFA